MDKIGEIEIRVVGKTGLTDLSPENYDIKQISSILQNVEDLLYPTNKKNRPIITYDIEKGSVKHKFKTTIQAVIGFSAILIQVDKTKSIDFLELKTARAIEGIQNSAITKNFEFQIKTSINDNHELIINPSTNFVLKENTLVEAELYFYRILKDAGGKNKANIHIDTKDYGYLSIETGEEFLKQREDNLLYKNYGVRAKGFQNFDTGEIDLKSLKLIELIDYDPKFDETHLKGLIKRAKNNWKNINPDGWLTKMRGEYEV